MRSFVAVAICGTLPACVEAEFSGWNQQRKWLSAVDLWFTAKGAGSPESWWCGLKPDDGKRSSETGYCCSERLEGPGLTPTCHRSTLSFLGVGLSILMGPRAGSFKGKMI